MLRAPPAGRVSWSARHLAVCVNQSGYAWARRSSTRSETGGQRRSTSGDRYASAARTNRRAPFQAFRTLPGVAHTLLVARPESVTPRADPSGQTCCYCENIRGRRGAGSTRVELCRLGRPRAVAVTRARLRAAYRRSAALRCARGSSPATSWDGGSTVARTTRARARVVAFSGANSRSNSGYGRVEHFA
jgi:hypothetical protein